MLTCDIRLARPRVLVEVLCLCVCLSVCLLPLTTSASEDSSISVLDTATIPDSKEHSPSEGEGHSPSQGEGHSPSEAEGHSREVNFDLDRVYSDITKEGFVLIGAQESGVAERVKRRVPRQLYEELQDTSDPGLTGRIEFGGQEVTLEEKRKLLLQTLPADVFWREVTRVQTFHDVIRLFYPNRALGLTNGELLRLYFSQVSTHTHRQPLGLSRPLTHSHHDTGGPDRMMGDSPHCIHCHEVPASVGFSEAVSQHRKRHKRKEVATHSALLTQGSMFSKRKLARLDKRKKREMNKATSHMLRMQDYECRQPTPTLVHINELQRDATRVYVPQCTVIHKCLKSSGCCNDGQECGVKAKQNVTLHFWAPKFVNGEISPTDDMVVTFTFENHTECGCQEVATIPNCAPCPPPFIQYYEDQTQCRCGCLDGDKKCKKIKRGKAHFNIESLKCMEDKECAYPQCAYGDFSPAYLRKGRCPHRKEVRDKAAKKKPKARRTAQTHSIATQWSTTSAPDLDSTTIQMLLNHRLTSDPSTTDWSTTGLSTTEPSTSNPSTSSPATTDLSTNNPSTDGVSTTQQETISEDSGVHHTVSYHSSTEAPARDWLMNDQSVTDPPMNGHSVSDQPVSDHFVTDSPMIDHSVTDPPMTDHSVSDPPMTDHSVTDSPMNDHSVTDPPVSEHSITDPPMTDNSVTSLPVTKESVLHTAVTDQSAVETLESVLVEEGQGLGSGANEKLDMR